MARRMGRKRQESLIALYCSKIPYSQDPRYRRASFKAGDSACYPPVTDALVNTAFSPFNLADWNIRQSPQKQMADTKGKAAEPVVVKAAPVAATKAKEAEPKKDNSLANLYEEAYYNFDPDVQIEEGFTARLELDIRNAGLNHQKRLVVAETPDYVNYLGTYYAPSDDKYKYLKRWLERKGLDAHFELSHSTLNFLASKKTLQVVVYFHPTTKK
jgi:hypothetical protein